MRYRGTSSGLTVERITVSAIGTTAADEEPDPAIVSMADHRRDAKGARHQQRHNAAEQRSECGYQLRDADPGDPAMTPPYSAMINGTGMAASTIGTAAASDARHPGTWRVARIQIPCQDHQGHEEMDVEAERGNDPVGKPWQKRAALEPYQKQPGRGSSN